MNVPVRGEPDPPAPQRLQVPCLCFLQGVSSAASSDTSVTVFGALGALREAALYFVGYLKLKIEMQNVSFSFPTTASGFQCSYRVCYRRASLMATNDSAVPPVTCRHGDVERWLLVFLSVICLLDTDERKNRKGSTRWVQSTRERERDKRQRWKPCIIFICPPVVARIPSRGGC